MKFMRFVFAFSLVFSASTFANNQHLHPKADDTSLAKAPTSVAFRGNCEIEIINRSFEDVRVYGVFDDGLSMDPFNVYSFEAPRYIPLFYYGYCHDGMDLYIDTFSGYNIFSGYVARYTTIRIVPSRMGSQHVKIELRAKK